MTQNLFATLTNPSLPLLDANFTQLFDLRELISTPGYSAANPALKIVSTKDVVFNGTAAQQVAANRGTITLNGVSSAMCVLSYASTPAGYFYSDSSTTELGNISNTPIVFWINGNPKVQVETSGIFRPNSDNAQSLGTSANRWSVVYAATGSINTSDGREKTNTVGLDTAEIAAAQALAVEIGKYRWLSAVASKGTLAREHIGLTVQRAIEVLNAHGLNAMAYGFICYDQWPAETVPARTEQRNTGLKDSKGDPIYETTVVEPERTIPGGDRYSFRHDELMLFLARGFEARLAALEAAIAP